MSNPSISILVPVYNVEKYLSRCIESALSQDFADWEMILVDDGSPDKCPQICDEYAQKDARIKVIHKKNGGLVSARLEGWKQAKAQYIINLDSDDYLMPHALTVLYGKAVEGNYDIVKGCDRRFNDEYAYEEIEKPHLLGTDIIGSTEYLKALLSNDILPYLWGGIYKRDLFSEELFEKVKHISINEDLITNIGIYQKVERYTTITDTVCSYFINPSSMMQQFVISHEHIDKIESLIHYFVIEEDSELRSIINLNSCATHIRCFFQPELSWNDEQYKKVKNILSVQQNKTKIHKQLDSKFLYFIKYKFLYTAYCKCYCFLFKKIKLRGKTRRII